MSPPYKQWLAKQLKMIERMSFLSKLKEAKLEAKAQAEKEEAASSSLAVVNQSEQSHDQTEVKGDVQ